MIKRTIIALLFISLTLCLVGCQTFEGLGGDIKWSGEQLQNGAGNFTK